MGLFGGKKNTTAQIKRGPWQLYSYTFGEGLRASIVFDLPAAREEQHRGYGACRRVVIYSVDDAVYGNGLPRPDEYQRLNGEEDALIAELGKSGVDCRNVGRMSYAAMRDIVFQVEDTAGFAAACKRWHKARGGRVDFVEADGWKFFDEKVRPTAEHWAWIENSSVVQQLMLHGADPAQPHRLEHHFLGKPDQLDEVATSLGYRELTDQSRGDGTLTVFQELELDVDAITFWTRRFHEIADGAGARYDGWGTLITRK